MREQAFISLSQKLKEMTTRKIGKIFINIETM